MGSDSNEYGWGRRRRSSSSRRRRRRRRRRRGEEEEQQEEEEGDVPLSRPESCRYSPPPAPASAASSLPPA
jgi:hypothetical protein